MIRTKPLRQRRPEPRPATQSTYTPRPRAVAVPSGEVQMAAPQPKEGRFVSEAWRRAVAELPCVFCGRPDVQASHRNEGKGLSLKTSDLCAALCVSCHADIDSGKNLLRNDRRAEWDRAFFLTVQALVRGGRVVLV